MIKIFIMLVVIMLLSGCADSVSFQDASSIESVGFLHGLWHGLIAPFSFLISLFDDDVAVYAIYNNGSWYDFGFLFGVGAFSSASTR